VMRASRSDPLSTFFLLLDSPGVDAILRAFLVIMLAFILFSFFLIELGRIK